MREVRRNKHFSRTFPLELPDSCVVITEENKLNKNWRVPELPHVQNISTQTVQNISTVVINVEVIKCSTFGNLTDLRKNPVFDWQIFIRSSENFLHLFSINCLHWKRDITSLGTGRSFKCFTSILQPSHKLPNAVMEFFKNSRPICESAVTRENS